jgi:hypothetical protein
MASVGRSVIYNPDDGKGHILTVDVQTHNKEAANPHGIGSARRAPSLRLLGRKLLPLEGSVGRLSSRLIRVRAAESAQRSERVAALGR